MSSISPASAFLLTAFVIASAMALITTGEGAAIRSSHGQEIDWGLLLVGRLTDWYSCAVTAAPLYWLVTRLPVERHSWPLAGPVHLLAGAAAAIAKFALYVPLRAALDPEYSNSFVGALSAGFVDKLMFFWAVTAVLHAVFFHLRARSLDHPSEALPIPHEPRQNDSLAVADGRSVLHLRDSDIDWIEAQGNYALIHSSRESRLVRETMASLAEKLQGRSFMRVHRSAIVNIDSVILSEPLSNGRYRLVLRNGATVTSARSNARELRRRVSSGMPSIT